MAAERKHVITIVVNDVQIGPWETYKIDTSMIVPSSQFSMKRPWNRDVWNIIRLDARVRVLIDGVVVLDGFIDKRRKSTKDDSIEIGGRCRTGRVVQETADAIDYEGLLLLDAVKRLVSPWYDKVTLSNARNRILLRGKGRRVPGGNEPLVVNIRVPRTGKVHPGMTRWAIIEEIASEAGLLAFGTGDGKEFFIGKPNYDQAPQYLIVHPKEGSRTKSTCLDLAIEEDNTNRYSMITVAGVGGNDEDDADYGENVTDRRGIAVDASGLDGTGGDFIFAKRLYMPERNFDSNGDAQRVADREMARRNFRRQVISATMPQHGQFVSSAAPTIFAIDTIARVIDEEEGFDEDCLIFSCSFEGERDQGETTALELVPVGTEIVQ